MEEFVSTRLSTRRMLAYSLYVSLVIGMFLAIDSPRLQKAKYVTSRADTTSNEMPAELDFFKYARAGTGKRKQQGSSSEQPSEKRRRVNEEAAEKDIGDDLKELTDKKRPQERHRVTSKGNGIPEAVDTFEALYKKYGIPSHVYRNLSESGYNYPTSIQSHAVPVLLEVRISSDSDRHLSFAG